jgi:putative flippase GtrA
MHKILREMGVESYSDFKALALQFLKFGVVGVSNTLVSLSIYYLFIWINPTFYQAGNVIGWTLGVMNSVFWNKKLVFKDSAESIWRILGKSYIAYAGSFLLTVALLHIQIEWIGISVVIAPLICIIFTTPLNFLANKYWAFKSFKRKQ